MKVGTLVILIGTDGYMPPLGSIGEIIEDFDGEDYGILFPNCHCPNPPGIHWYTEPWMIRPISGLPLQEDEQTDIKIPA